MASRFRGVLAATGLATLITAVPVTMPYRSGADSALSGGAPFGANCTTCHEFNEGPGGVNVVGLPRRYRVGATYEFGIHVFDPEQKGAGFELSAEGGGSHLGTLLITNATTTWFADFGTATDYITHTYEGVDASIAAWSTGDGGYTYDVGWQAPMVDAGPVTFFAAGNAVNDNFVFLDDRYYAGYATLPAGTIGDADGDTDLDLLDFAALQRCFSGEDPAIGGECEWLDFDDDGTVSLSDLADWNDAADGPTAPFPADYVLADAVRGGKLYDEWWIVNGAAEPMGEHPLYPMDGSQFGSTTYRCKECHGWDYEGVAGAYASGSHFTGIPGVLGTSMTPREIFALLKADPTDVPNGHDMGSLGLSDRDLWDLVKMVREGAIDTSDLIDANGEFLGSVSFGGFGYSLTCVSCHGSDGKGVGDTPIGAVAVSNPWEFVHTVRFGHPGAPMPASDLLGWSSSLIIDLGAYVATLPTE